MVEQDKKKVARGATLYSDKTKKDKVTPEHTEVSSRVKRRIMDIKSDPANSIIKPIKDEKYKKEVIDFLGVHGIEVTSYKERYIARRVKVRLGRLRLDSYRDYLKYLQTNPQEIRLVKESLSINVTRFFRNRDTFDLLKDQIFPEMLNRATKTSRAELNLWSAGCAVGAEPYTMAIVASDSIASQIKVKILATDVKNELISIAKNGVYSEQYLAEMDKSDIIRHFQKIGDENFEILRTTRNLVTFKQHDLMKDSYPSNLDMIICRNVLIYVDRDAQQEIVKNFFDALRPGGILVLGRTETLFGDWRKDIDIVSTKHRIYQKKAGAKSVYSTQVDTKRDKITSKTDRKLIPTRKKHTAAVKSSPPSGRLEELRDFRKTFEQRKALWDSRIDKQDEAAETGTKISHPRTLQSSSVSIKRSNLRTKKTGSKVDKQMSSNFPPKRVTTREETKPEIRPKADKGLLSNYRSMLVKTQTPTRGTAIRTAKQEETKFEINYKQTPEEVYRTLKKRKRIRDLRK